MQDHDIQAQTIDLILGLNRSFLIEATIQNWLCNLFLGPGFANRQPDSSYTQAGQETSPDSQQTGKF